MAYTSVDYIKFNSTKREEMTKFEFSFEKRRSNKNELTNHLAGSYNFLTDEVKVYLANIASASTLVYVPDFMKIFKRSYVRECEDKCITQIQKTLKHEYEHKALCYTECPLGEQHKAIDAIEAMEMTVF